MNNTLKQILGKAAYKGLRDNEIKTIRSIVRKHDELAQWHRAPGGLLAKLKAYMRSLRYDWKFTRKLTTRDFYLAYGRKFRQYDRIDFIHNHHLPILPE